MPKIRAVGTITVKTVDDTGTITDETWKTYLDKVADWMNGQFFQDSNVSSVPLLSAELNRSKTYEIPDTD